MKLVVSESSILDSETNQCISFSMISPETDKSLLEKGSLILTPNEKEQYLSVLLYLKTNRAIDEEFAEKEHPVLAKKLQYAHEEAYL